MRYNINRMERREFLRFPTSLEVGVKKGGKGIVSGRMKDFCRFGLRAVFDEFDFSPNNIIELEIQRPTVNTFIPARGEIMWKQQVKGKWEVGIRLQELPPPVKGEILDYGYNRWLRNIPDISRM